MAGVLAPVRPGAHLPAVQAGPGLDRPEDPRPGRRGPVDLADHRLPRPAAPGPPAGRRPAPPLGTARAAGAADPRPGPPGISGTSARWSPVQPVRRNPANPDRAGRPDRRTATRRHATTWEKRRRGSSRSRPDANAQVKPKLRPIRQAISGLTWDFTAVAGWCSDYFKVSGIGAPMSSKACRWALVGSASIAMVTWVPVYRTWLRVSVARCSSRPRKLR